MRHPWANVILLILLFLQLITGYFGFVNGLESRQWLLWLHGIGAYAIVLLLFWKGSIIWQALSRGTGMSWQQWAFIALTGLLLLTLLLGLWWTVVGESFLFHLSLLSLHIYLAIPLMVLLVWHFWQRRWILYHPQATGRRLFLRLAGLSLAGWATWWASGRVERGPQRRFTGSYEIGTFSGHFPATSWLADHPDPVDMEQWRLIVSGRVEQPLHLTYEQLLQQAHDQQSVTLDCTGGFYTTQIWQGLNLGQLLAQAIPQAEARSVTIRAVSGYYRRFSLAEARHLLLATHVADQPLSHSHGYPLRLVAKDKRGFHWVKWVSQIEINDTSAFWQPPLPLQ